MIFTSIAYWSPNLCSAVTTSALAAPRRHTSRPSASSIRSSRSAPACRARSIMRAGQDREPLRLLERGNEHPGKTVKILLSFFLLYGNHREDDRRDLCAGPEPVGH